VDRRPFCPLPGNRPTVRLEPPPSRGPRPSLSREPPSKKAHAANALRIILPAESISSFRKGPFNLGATAVMAASATPATSERRRRGLSTYPYENSADAMTPQEFIGKWRPVALTERQAAQEHFIDLCRLFRHPTPVEADPSGEWYCFEKGAMKSTGNPGWADVWKRGFFAFEYKKRKKNLKEAQDQLAPLRLAPREPADPLLLIVLHRRDTSTARTSARSTSVSNCARLASGRSDPARTSKEANACIKRVRCAGMAIRPPAV
jgi:hypothetical protein